MENKSLITPLKGIKWEIIDTDKAKKAKLRAISINSDNAFLEINIQNIPQGITIQEYIEHIVETGIVVVNKPQ